MDVQLDVDIAIGNGELDLWICRFHAQVFWDPEPLEMSMSSDHARVILLLDIEAPGVSGRPICSG